VERKGVKTMKLVEFITNQKQRLIAWPDKVTIRSDAIVNGPNSCIINIEGMVNNNGAIDWFVQHTCDEAARMIAIAREADGMSKG
jgi:predicted metal-dependent RNase